MNGDEAYILATKKAEKIFATAIKTKKYTGTTASTQGGMVKIVHGLSTSKILSVKAVINFSGGALVTDNYTANSGFCVGISLNSTEIDITNQSGNSGNVLSKPFRILITYEE